MTSFKKNARAAALNVLNRVAAGDAYADILLENALDSLDESERPLATEITYGVLRQQIRIDWIIGLFSDVKIKKMETAVLNALRIGIYQIFFLSGVPRSAAVNESVELVKSGGKKRAGFVNAVLRRAASEGGSVRFPDMESEPVTHVSVVYSHPEWMVRRWIGRYGLNEAIELCKANLMVPPRTLRANTLVSSRDKLLKELTDEGLETGKSYFSPDGLEILGGGKVNPKDPRYYIQDEASQLISYLVAPGAGEAILDACSAPGGKATHMAQLMENTGVIYALDRYAGRLKSVEEAARRLKVDIIRTIEADSESPLTFTAPPGGFDAVLIDAPCSGLGVLRRSPDIKLRRKEEDLKELSGRQKRILDNMAGYVKKGGRIVYSTCTFEPEETVEVIKDFLTWRKDFILEGAGGYVPEVCKGLVDGSGLFRTYPHRHRMDGFFGARLKKV